ncbi:ATPase, T2SS/T4P/T4SS family [Halomarina halobia]|uniref:ATPase, T2SS/T4P/T4SS family n=1 Tax=Halomarina halobia TaxID=3033386 RepID=A0ABD6AC56_9EURY|nr:ATPase, T2SS/T4P/T4SS family [Halomarina sp. PSR21]
MSWFRFGSLGRGSPPACACRPRADGDRLVVDASDCDGGGVVERSPDCRETVVDALARRDAEAVLVRAAGVERSYEEDAAALLLAAGRFVEAVAHRDEALAERARRDPLLAARQATGRAGALARIAAETGLAEGAARAEGYEDALRPRVGPTVARARVAVRPPSDARLVERRDLDTGAVARIYERPGDELRLYHLVPPEHAFADDALAALAAAYERLAAGDAPGDRTAGRAVRAVADASEDANVPVERLAAVLEKHTAGAGVLDDFFADPDCSDVFVTAPADAAPLRVRRGDETLRTNVGLTERGVETLASRFRRTSGRAFSRASPTLDAVTTAGGRRVRVAGVTDPASDGVGFAFRAHDVEAWTIAALVANGTLPAGAAAVCSLAVERDAACLVTGGRASGKTTLLSALCWELPAAVRVVAIEDTPELPVAALRDRGRDVQRLRADADADADGFSPEEAVRTALRLGDGALVVGEVRGAEAGALFEAMRVGANDSAVLGTIHGDGGESVRERLVSDLGVPERALGTTDLLVTCALTPEGRRVAAIEEVCAVESGVAFAPLFERSDGGLASTGRVERGESQLLDCLARPGESYADLREALDARRSWLDELAAADLTDAATVVSEHARRRGRDRRRGR